MFKTNRVYRHMSTLDIDLYVTKVEQTESCAKLRVYYVNRHLEQVVAGPQQVTVKRTDFDKWKDVTNEQV